MKWLLNNSITITVNLCAYGFFCIGCNQFQELKSEPTGLLELIMGTSAWGEVDREKNTMFMVFRGITAEDKQGITVEELKELIRNYGYTVEEVE